MSKASSTNKLNIQPMQYHCWGTVETCFVGKKLHDVF